MLEISSIFKKMTLVPRVPQLKGWPWQHAALDMHVLGYNIFCIFLFCQEVGRLEDLLGRKCKRRNVTQHPGTTHSLFFSNQFFEYYANNLCKFKFEQLWIVGTTSIFHKRKVGRQKKVGFQIWTWSSTHQKPSQHDTKLVKNYLIYHIIQARSQERG